MTFLSGLKPQNGRNGHYFLIEYIIICYNYYERGVL